MGSGSVLIAVADVKRRLGIPSGVTQHDDAIGDLVDGIDEWLCNELDVPALSYQQWTETLDVDREATSAVRLKARPVRSVSSLKDDGDTVGSDEYRVLADEGYVELTDDGAFYTVGRQKVQVTYYAGWQTTDAFWTQLVRAAVDQCAFEFGRGSLLGVASTVAGRRKVAPAGGRMPASVAAVVARYRRVF